MEKISKVWPSEHKTRLLTNSHRYALEHHITVQSQYTSHHIQLQSNNHQRNLTDLQVSRPNLVPCTIVELLGDYWSYHSHTFFLRSCHVMNLQPFFSPRFCCIEPDHTKIPHCTTSSHVSNCEYPKSYIRTSYTRHHMPHTTYNQTPHHQRSWL